MYKGKHIHFLGEPKHIDDIEEHISKIGGINCYYDEADIIIMSDSRYNLFKRKTYRPNSKLAMVQKRIDNGSDLKIISESDYLSLKTTSIKNGRTKGNSIREKLANYTVIDLETTGKYITSCEIIEMSAVKVRFGKVVDTFSTLVKPKGVLPQEVVKLTGITSDMLKSAPLITESIDDYVNFIGNDVILGHNITAFDSNLIYDAYYSCSGSKFSNDMLDTYHYARCCDIEVSDYRLVTLAKYFNIENNNAHRALNDCLVNFECYEALKPLFNNHYKCSNGKQTKKLLPNISNSIQTLIGIIKGILCDNILADAEIIYLHNWMKDNSYLSGHYPFDIIFNALNDILEDGIISKNEREFLLEILVECLNSADNFSEPIRNTSGIEGKNICLTGEFEICSRPELAQLLESMGAVIKSGISSKVDYLFVGIKGNEKWSCENYGTKIKKALELKEKGINIKIIKEDELKKWLDLNM